MTEIVSFEFEQTFYQAVVLAKHDGNSRQYRITIMNGDLEKMLFGCHTILEKAGNFLFANTHAGVEKLQLAISKALKKHFSKKTAKD